MKYPAILLMEPGARGEVLSIALAGKGQHQDAGAKIYHLAPNTSSQVISKSIVHNGGVSTFRGLVKVAANAHNSKAHVKCDALMLDEFSKSDTIPTIDIQAKNVSIGHEATAGKISDDQLFYLRSRGLSENEAIATVVRGFIEPFAKSIPAEYAVELNRLIELEMEGSVG
jgi:Fe-S cluster assembly protein SufB